MSILELTTLLIKSLPPLPVTTIEPPVPCWTVKLLI